MQLDGLRLWKGNDRSVYRHDWVPRCRVWLQRSTTAEPAQGRYRVALSSLSRTLQELAGELVSAFSLASLSAWKFLHLDN